MVQISHIRPRRDARYPARSALRPAKPPRLDRNADDPWLLPQVNHDRPERPWSEMVEGFWRIIEAVDDLDDWMDVCVFNEANKALERRTMSHGHALDARATQHERHGAELHVEPAEKTDDGNLATRRQRVNRFGKVLATDDLQDMVDATTARRLPRGNGPVPLDAGVDDGRGPQLANARKAIEARRAAGSPSSGGEALDGCKTPKNGVSTYAGT